MLTIAPALTIEQRLRSQHKQVVIEALHSVADLPQGEGKEFVDVVKSIVMSTKCRDTWLVGKEALWAHDMDAYMDVESNHVWGEFTPQGRLAAAATVVVVDQRSLVVHGD
jgi:hypothetical protein